jgi:hypothetical protein
MTPTADEGSVVRAVEPVPALVLATPWVRQHGRWSSNPSTRRAPAPLPASGQRTSDPRPRRVPRWPARRRFDRLFATLARTTDPHEARRLAEDIDRHCFEQSKALFLCAPQALYAVNKHVDFKAYRATFELADTEVDPAHWSRRNEEGAAYSKNALPRNSS